jgi:ubiquinone/menaquinone biosynthesis C-methylase UbiE
MADLADILADLQLPAGTRRALDVGCGHGADVRWLAAQGFVAAGLDVNQDALDAAAASTPDDLDVNWILGRATSLPFEDGALTLVTDRGCLHHLPGDDRPRYAAEVGRVLAPGGVWILRHLVGHHGQVDELDEAGAAALARAGGLRVESTDMRRAGHHAWLVAVLRRD